MYTFPNFFGLNYYEKQANDLNLQENRKSVNHR